MEEPCKLFESFKLRKQSICMTKNIICKSTFKKKYTYIGSLPEKNTAVFPMQFRENTDVVIVTAFFQELMDVGSSESWAKVPPCSWSPIPPPGLRGEASIDLSTNGGEEETRQKSLKSIELSCRLEIPCKAYVHILRIFSILQEINTMRTGSNHVDRILQFGCKFVRKLVNLSKSKSTKRRCGNFTKWLRIPKFSSSTGYIKLDYVLATN
ncbi:hypothetical protein RJ641_021458 [Dillenia turbinata]|uniref:Uncharacterized protein n=1 Tax=Dillenia turbinata TaxID=194707 RepID=A0AAN8UPE6_9MAGN